MLSPQPKNKGSVTPGVTFHDHHNSNMTNQKIPSLEDMKFDPPHYSHNFEGSPIISHADIPVISEPEDEIPVTPVQPETMIRDPPSNLGFLSSANFSSDSLTDPSAPPVDYYGNYSNNYSPRRYSNSSTSTTNTVTNTNNSPGTMYRTNSNTRSRPLSAFLMDSSNAISEDGQPVLPVFNNTSRSRNSLTFGVKTPTTTTFTPPPPATAGFRSSSPTRQGSPLRINKHYRSGSPVRRGSSPSKAANPFNFNSQDLMFQHSNGSNLTLQVKPAHRKGHKYKHSSVSMNLFQEPPPISLGDVQLAAIPDLYPIPNCRETIASVTHNQKLRFLWSVCHLGLSFVVFALGFKFKLSALSTLAHLVFYDSLGSLLIVFVDTMSNFEVWNKSSIAYPFGLGRIEVLVAFALSTSLVMVGFDLFSHFIEEFIVLWAAPENHSDHEHLSHHVHAEPGSKEANWTAYMGILVVTMIVSLISSNYILTYDRINEMMNNNQESNTVSNGLYPNTSNRGSEKPTSVQRQKWMQVVEVWKKNPAHFITLSYTLFLIISPLVPQSLTSDLAIDINEFATISVAALLCYNGWKLVKLLGGILLCSFPYSDYDYNVIRANITDQILLKDFFKQSYKIEKFFITKFNYKLFIVGMKIDMKGANSDEEVRMRFEVNRIIRRELEQLEGSSNPLTAETTIDIDRF
ncbi:Protein ZRG17 [Candida viswanathii]|uniref:Protein ZRG17 n=1 Tax=Candida viswanathii TaxID=5486 RepID=A0A367XPD6_9ASCO|nr:Protein ZRG17 [Candida viswanathii]